MDIIKNTYSIEEYEEKKKFHNMGFLTDTAWKEYKNNYEKFHKHYDKEGRE